jgi:methionine synthase II (cobalamin-independent)
LTTARDCSKLRETEHYFKGDIDFVNPALNLYESFFDTLITCTASLGSRKLVLGFTQLRAQRNCSRNYVHSELGFTVYKEILANFAKTVNAFAQSSIVNAPRIKTKIIAIDEPSLGFIDLFNVDEADLVSCLDLALAGLPDDVVTQIHLHSLRDAHIPLQTKNIDVLTCEFASDPTNTIDRNLLEQHHKKMRVGICRTNYNAIIGKMIEEGRGVGTGYDDQVMLVDGEDKIKTALQKAIEHYGAENLAYVGPDCGLSSWAPPELAQMLLKRVVNVIQQNAV